MSNATWNEYARHAFIALDDDKIDKEWFIRNIVGGMSAGFGLRGLHLSSLPGFSLAKCATSDFGRTPVADDTSYYHGLGIQNARVKYDWSLGRRQ